jgi:hypothetical protein
MTATSPGTWMVEEATEAAIEGTYLHRVISVGPEGTGLVGLLPNMADAALLSASKELLDLLIWIHEELNYSKRTVSIEEFNLRFSQACEMIAAESGDR